MIYSDTKQAAFLVEQDSIDQVSFGPQLINDPAYFTTVGTRSFGSDLKRSSSSSTTSGMTIVCSLNANKEWGECNSTFVSST